MTDHGNFSPEMQVTETHEGVRYRLPARPLGQLRVLGLVPIALGLTFSGTGTFFAVTAIAGLFTGQGGWGSGFSAIMPLVIGGMFAFGGLIPMRIGLFVLGGRCDVELRKDHLRSIERAGIVRKVRRLPLEHLQSFQLITAGGGREAAHLLLDALGNLAALSVKYTYGEKRNLAVGYPLSMLRPIADDLSRRIGLASPAQLRGSLGPNVVVASAKLGADLVPVRLNEWQPQRVTQPPQSRAIVEREVNHLTISLPPAGIIKGSRGLFFFALLWCGFMTVFSGMTVIAPMRSGTGNLLTSGVMAFALFSLLFWAIGIAMLIGAINMGRRRAILDVLEGTLLINIKSIFGIKQHQWDVNEIDRIVVGPSGMTMNENSIMELQVHPIATGKVGLFSGRDEAELKWLAWSLHHALMLDEQKRQKEAANQMIVT